MRRIQIIYNRIIPYSIISILIISFMFIGCSKEEKPSIDKVLLVYFGCDNNLSNEVLSKTNSLANGFDNNPNNRILIYSDIHNDAPALLEISSKGQIDTIEKYNNENSADPAVFKRFLVKAKNMYPQAQFNLLVFSHASGWLPNGALKNPTSRSIIIDGNNEMDFIDFASNIPDNMFECIIFEACFMSGIEVVYELKDKTKYIIASSAEILSPGFMSIYENQSHLLVDGKFSTFMQSAFEYFDNKKEEMRSATFSIIKTKYLDILASYIQKNCDFSKQIEINKIQHFDRYNSYLFSDFEDYYSRMLNTKEEIEEFNILINKSIVVWKASTPEFFCKDGIPNYGGFKINKHSGLTSYIMQDRYPKINERYKELSWYKYLNK